MSRPDVVAAARNLIGTPFRHQGRLPGIGLDCAGLVVVIAHELGIPHRDVAGYGRRPFQGQLEAVLASQPGLQSVAVADLVEGDLLLMRFGRDPQHLAIHAGGTIIHAAEEFGKVAEHRLDDTWRRRIVAAYRFTESA
nr:C40 family peptidase [Dechloromonas sp.]